MNMDVIGIINTAFSVGASEVCQETSTGKHYHKSEPWVKCLIRVTLLFYCTIFARKFYISFMIAKVMKLNYKELEITVFRFTFTVLFVV